MARHWLISYKWVVNSMWFHDRSLVIASTRKPTLSVAHDFAVKEFNANVVGTGAKKQIGTTIPSQFVRIHETSQPVTFGNYLGCCSGPETNPPPVTPTSPTDFPQLRFWYKADAGTFSDLGNTPATNGQLVEQWNDSSGNGFNLTQPTSGSRPTFVTNQQNGLPVVDFPVTGLSMVNNAIGFSQPVTIYLACIVGNTSPTKSLVCRFYTNNSGNDSNFIHMGYDFGGYFIEADPGLIGTSQPSDGTFIFTAVFNQSSSIFRVNQVPAGIFTNVMGNAALGAFLFQNNALISTMDFKALECFGYPLAHDLPTMLKIEGYLKNKWNIL